MKVSTLILWLGAVGFIVVFPFTIGRMSSYYCGVLVLAAIYVILAISLDLLMGYTGQISVGHAAFFGIGAYASGILTTRYGFTPVSALFIGVVITGAFAWVIGRSVLSLKEYYLAMATLAFNEIVVTLITGLDWFTGGGTGLRDIPGFDVFGISLADPMHYYYFVWTITIIMVASALAVVKSPFGLTLTAIHSDEEAARHFGINAPKYKTRIFVLAAVYASIAGSLFAHYMGFIAPNDFGILSSINILVMLFLGGAGTIIGPAFGAVFLKLLPEITYSFHDYELLLDGLILIVILVFFPKGLYGIFGSLKSKLFGGRSR